MAYTLAQIAHIETDFSEKFGIPRQSGLVEELRARIVFEPEFRSPDAVRGLDGYDYIWLVWQFSTVVQAGQLTRWRRSRILKRTSRKNSAFRGRAGW